ncbi:MULTISPECIES: hypothetical protein [unclassified Sutcliffiella]|uniref:hypothetical protein n=1 Tax=unclassified Sutcliffiella TaxID=2837532 RepID=UPI0030CEBF54
MEDPAGLSQFVYTLKLLLKEFLFPRLMRQAVFRFKTSVKGIYINSRELPIVRLKDIMYNVCVIFV